MPRKVPWSGVGMSASRSVNPYGLSS
jgi:hypothetical protein